MSTVTPIQTDPPVIVIHDGRRGPGGLPGPRGEPGEQGRSISVTGQWISGTSYGPGDAVTDRSTLMDGVTSLYIQRDNVPVSVSNTPPWQNAARWVEVSNHDWGNSFGGIWEVYQLNHGFTRIGQPVGYSWQANRYVLASATAQDELGIAVVREIIDADRVLLQSTGEVPNIDPAVVYPDSSGWDTGRIYYVSTARGRLETSPPAGTNGFANPILIVADDDPQTGGKNGVALPWYPSPVKVEYRPVGTTKFYFTATAGQTVLQGPDDDNNLLRYIVGPNTDVFVNGLNQIRTAFTATDGLKITMDTPLQAGDMVEIWTPDRPLDILVRSTTLKLDNIDAQFDGTQQQFTLTYGAAPVVFQDAASLEIILDATPQEPFVDFDLIDIGGNIAIEFKEAPERGTRFWGVALSPSGQAGVPPGGAQGALLGKASSADGDMIWYDVLDGGTW